MSVYVQLALPQYGQFLAVAFKVSPHFKQRIPGAGFGFLARYHRYPTAPTITAINSPTPTSVPTLLNSISTAIIAATTIHHHLRVSIPGRLSHHGRRSKFTLLAAPPKS